MVPGYGHPDRRRSDGRERLARSLSGVVRAWSESSIRVGLSPEHVGLVDELYDRLSGAFFETPAGLPYQYCPIDLVRADSRPGKTSTGPAHPRPGPSALRGRKGSVIERDHA